MFSPILYRYWSFIFRNESLPIPIDEIETINRGNFEGAHLSCAHYLLCYTPTGTTTTTIHTPHQKRGGKPTNLTITSSQRWESKMG